MAGYDSDPASLVPVTTGSQIVQRTAGRALTGIVAALASTAVIAGSATLPLEGTAPRMPDATAAQVVGGALDGAFAPLGARVTGVAGTALWLKAHAPEPVAA